MGDFPGVKVQKALGDDCRIRAVLALREHELCVGQIVELLELAPSTAIARALTHDPQTVQKAGRTLRLRDGRILSGNDEKDNAVA